MEVKLKDIVPGILNKFSSESGDEKLQIASLWEALAGPLSKETKIVKIENALMFIQVPHSVLAQELKVMPTNSSPWSAAMMATLLAVSIESLPPM